MKKMYLGGVLLSLFGITCGDLDQASNERIRNFVKVAKKVAIDELLYEGNSQADIDRAIAVVAEELGSHGGVTPPDDGTVTPPDDGTVTPPDDGVTPPSESVYTIKQSHQNSKMPGEVFPITLITSGATVVPTIAASLDAYDKDDIAVDSAIAMWKTESGDDIFDVSVGAGESARFNVFLVRDTTGVQKLGGTVDGMATSKVTLTAASYANPNDIAIRDDSGSIVLLFYGAAKQALTAADNRISYVVVDANGVVQSHGDEDLTNRLLNFDSGLGASISDSCVLGAYVLVRIGSSSKVYLPRCQS